MSVDVDELDMDRDFEMVEEQEVEQKESNTPSPDSPEWSDWALSQLTKDELYDGNPTCDGLRRLAIKILGQFNVKAPTVHFCSQEYAAVTVNLYWPGTGRSISASAEVHSGNADAPFNQYPLATAETRALGRALRIALNLRKVVTAEEVSRKANISIPITDEARDKGAITSTQKKFVNLMCKKHDISIDQVVAKALDSENKKLDDLTYEEAQKVQELLDAWAKDKPDFVESYKGE